MLFAVGSAAWNLLCEYIFYSIFYLFYLFELILYDCS